MAKKLTITPWNLDKTGTKTSLKKSQAFEVTLNPSDYKSVNGLKYSNVIYKGKTGDTPKFVATADEKLSFSIVIDNTGVVPDSRDVQETLKDLRKVCYDFVGTKHEPNVVQISWGGMIFDGRLTSISTDYTLFKPNGEPLRAKVELSFIDYLSVKESEAITKKSSPDLTHLVEVQAGDSLPLLCQKIYQDSSYYLEVAKINGITNFRNIKPGMKLNFPPLR